MVEPACWSWDVPPLRDRNAEVDRMMAEMVGLPRDQQMPRSACELVLRDMAAVRFDAFHAGRCALCGGPDATVDDHDHATGLRRGWLCRGCNVAEGMGARDVARLYGERNPASILDFRRYYIGYGWPLLWWADMRSARRLTGDPGWEPIAGATV